MVITVIAILSGLAIVTYQTIRTEARDAKRKADIEALVSIFEKYYDENGEYPTGCSKMTAANKLSCAYYEGGWGSIQPTNNPNGFYSDTTLSAIQTVLPSVTNNFGNPSLPSDPLFKGYRYNNSNKGYFYLGQLLLNNPSPGYSESGNIFGTNNDNEVNCGTGTIYLPALQNAPTTFILGYWSEMQSRWFIYQGKRGAELTSSAWSGNVRGTTVGQCTFVQ